MIKRRLIAWGPMCIATLLAASVSYAVSRTVGQATRDRSGEMAKLDILGERVAALESQIAALKVRVGTIGTTVHLDVTESRETVRVLHERLRALEGRADAGLEQASGDVAPLPEGASLEDVRSALRAVEWPLHPAADPRKRREAELLELLLARSPEAEDARASLERLVSLRILRGEASAARDAVRRWASQMGLKSWECARLLAQVASSTREFEEFRAQALMVVNSPEAGELLRAECAFQSAFSLLEEGRTPDAVLAFREFLDRFDRSTEAQVQVLCLGARGNLEILEAQVDAPDK